MLLLVWQGHIEEASVSSSIKESSMRILICDGWCWEERSGLGKREKGLVGIERLRRLLLIRGYKSALGKLHLMDLKLRLGARIITK